MINSNFSDLIAIPHKLSAMVVHLKFNNINIKLVSLLNALQNITSFLLMIIPLKALLFILSDRYYFAILGDNIDKFIYLSILILIFLFFAIIDHFIKARIKTIKYQLSVKYRNIDRYKVFNSQNYFVVPIIDHMIDFYSSIILFSLYFAIALLIKPIVGFLYAFIVVMFAFVFLRVKNSHTTKRLSYFFYFRIISITLTLIFIVSILNETVIFLSLVLFFVTRQWLAQIIQIGSVLVKLDNVKMPRVLISRKLDDQETLKHPTIMKTYINDEIKHNIIKLISRKVEGKYVELNEFRFRYLYTPLSSIDTFYLSGPQNDLVPKNNLVVYYKKLQLFLSELELQPLFRCSSLTCDIEIVQHRELNGVVFKEEIGSRYSKNSFMKNIQHILVELWKVNPEYGAVNGINDCYIERNLNKNIIEDLILIAENDQERAILSSLAQKTDLIIEKISKYPQVFFHPFFSSDIFFQGNDDTPRMIGFGYLEVAPVGVQLAFIEKDLSPEQLNVILKQLLSSRPEFSNILPDDLLVPKIAYQFLRAFRQAQYVNAKYKAIKLAAAVERHDI